MIFAFRASLFGSGVMPFEQPKEDPSKPVRRAVQEMEAFDQLPAEVRAVVSESPNDIGLAGKLASIRSVGCPRAVLEKIRARGLMPYQVGEAGILTEVIADELANLPPPLRPHRVRRRRI
jgi:hypothetical protein